VHLVGSFIENVSFQLLSLDDKIRRDYRTIRNLLYEIGHRTFEVLTTVLLKFESTGTFHPLV
jgi:hypothetical protein